MLKKLMLNTVCIINMIDSWWTLLSYTPSIILIFSISSLQDKTCWEHYFFLLHKKYSDWLVKWRIRAQALQYSGCRLITKICVSGNPILIYCIHSTNMLNHQIKHMRWTQISPVLKRSIRNDCNFKINLKGRNGWIWAVSITCRCT